MKDMVTTHTSRFDIIEVTLSCGCVRLVKRWYAEQHMTLGHEAECFKHGLVKCGLPGGSNGWHTGAE